MSVIQSFQMLTRLLKSVKTLKKWQANPSWAMLDFWYTALKMGKDRDCLVFVDENRSMSYQEVEEYTNRLAQWFIDNCGVSPGGCVSLVKGNSPEFVLTWLALAKTATKVALINHNLTGAPLANCIKLAAKESNPSDSSSESRNIVIYSSDIANNLTDPDVLAAIGEDGLQFEFWQYNGAGNTIDVPKGGNGTTWQSLDANFESYEGSLSKEASVKRRKDGKPTDIFLYIYTSGTTGLPKAARISHIRFALAGTGMGDMFDFKKTDRMYCCLPLYHSAGGMLGVSTCWRVGAALVIRSKFSASNFMKDCTEFKCTAAQYIGELLRYLTSSPPSEWDRKHRLRVMVGNGLRKTVWEDFQNRFKVKKIAEFYGATEGNASLLNFTGKIGAIGFLPALIRAVYPVMIVRVNPDDEEEVVRRKNGLCIPCKSGEAGHLIGLIKEGDASRAFDGYTNENANAKKILRDAKKKGDKWFLTGDLVKRVGPYVYFVDRIGDTFRWKGENSSTREVEEVIATNHNDEQIEEINIYGVTIQEQDGKCGMAYIRLKDGVKMSDFDLAKFYDMTKEKLPSYQVPLFVRFTEGKFTLTSTFKHQKVALRRESFDPAQVKENLFFRNPTTNAYEPIDDALYADINSGKFKL